MTKTIKIIATNWLNLIGIFIVAYAYAFIQSYAVSSFSVIQALLSSLILVALYGIIFWIGFVIVISVLDTLLLGFSTKNLLLKLIIEWLIISGFFLFWAFKYNQWIFLAAVSAFLITQLLRKEKIAKIIEE